MSENEYVLMSLAGNFFSGQFNAIGPVGTGDIAKAKRYPSALAALGSPARRHPLSTYTPQRVADLDA